MNKYSIEFTIGGLPKTTNASGRAHWAVKAKEARYWKAQVGFAVLGSKPIRALEKARLTLTRGSTTCPDLDGLVSSFKHVIDGLVSAGILTDDKMDNIGIPVYVHQKAPRGFGYIRVRVEEL